MNKQPPKPNPTRPAVYGHRPRGITIRGKRVTAGDIVTAVGMAASLALVAIGMVMHACGVSP